MGFGSSERFRFVDDSFAAPDTTEVDSIVGFVLLVVSTPAWRISSAGDKEERCCEILAAPPAVGENPAAAAAGGAVVGGEELLQG
jgi:hypothetical protein